MEAKNIYGIEEIKNLGQRSREYINSNDMTSNVVFILVILIVSIILFNFFMKFTLNMFSLNNSPHLIDGMVNARDSDITITQDPKNSSSKTILISENKEGGLEFTWSFWIYIEDLDYRRGELKNVFVKGDNMMKKYTDFDAPCSPDLACSTPMTANEKSILILYRTLLKREPDSGGFKSFVAVLNNGTKTLDDITKEFKDSAEYKSLHSQSGNPYDEIENTINSPGVYLTPHDNKLLFVFNTFEHLNEQFEIDNIPMNKWVNVIIRCENRTVDIFMNSSFAHRHLLDGLPKQNYNNVHIGNNKGFSGYVSNLWYYNYALGSRAINNIYRKGANTNLLNGKDDNVKNQVSLSKDVGGTYRPNYLSFRWFFA